MGEFLKLNRLEGDFNVIQWNISKNGVWVSFQPDDELLKKLQAKRRLTSNGGTFYPIWHLRKSLTEEQYFARGKKVEESTAAVV